MLSRVAYNIYWLARYLERAENVARFLAVNQDLSLDDLQGDEAAQWSPLIETTGDHEYFSDSIGPVTRESVIRFLAYDRKNPNSIISSLWMARENARAVRNVISRDMWMRINALYLEVVAWADRENTEESAIVTFSELVKMGCITVQGVTNATLSRGETWHWWHIGNMIERADKTSRILDVKYFMLLPSSQKIGGNFDHAQWIALLDSASAAQMFLQSEQRMSPTSIAAFLILDQSFPRSIAYTLVEADKSLHAISGSAIGQFTNPAERAMGRLRADLCYADIEDVIAQGLHEYLDTCQLALNKIDSLLYTHYFSGKQLD